MSLKGRRKPLNIIYENEQVDQKQIEYRLYETNFTATLSYIFQDALEREHYKCKYNKMYSSQEEKINIFPFIGKRGSGKTTALKEFCRILENVVRQIRSGFISQIRYDFISDFGIDPSHYLRALQQII